MNAVRLLRRMFSSTPTDPIAFWRTRAADPGRRSVMWANEAYNDCAQRDQWAAILRALPARRANVLDLGCGTGRLTGPLCALFDRYVGVDLDTMVAEARRRNPDAAAEFIGASVQEYEFPERKFDLVLSMACLASACTALELPRVAARMVAATRPGGRIILIDPFHRTPALVRTCRMSAAEVIRHFMGFGVDRIEWTAIHFIPCRLLLSRRAVPERDRFTRAAYVAGEALRRIAPRLLGDYHVIVLQKPADR